MKQLFYIATLIISSGFAMQAQTLNAYLNAADEAIENGDHYSALVWYQDALEFESDNVLFLHKAAESARKINSFTLAERYYKQVAEMDAENEYPATLYYLAKVQQTMGKYDTAQLNYELYLSEHEGEDPQLTERAKKEVKACEWAQEKIDNPWSEYEITHLPAGINTIQTEFGAVKLGDTLFYSSLRFEYDEDKYDPDRPVSGVLVSEGGDAAGEQLWEEYEPGKHTAHTAFSKNHKRMYYTVCGYEEANYIRCDLYYRDRENGSWGDPVKLPARINDTAHTSTQPNVGVNPQTGEDVLYYVSDRDGGKGEFDIWSVTVSDTGFSSPVNLEHINTPLNDISPFYHHGTDLLYFSSQGHRGLGGYDIFKVMAGHNGMGEIQHLGHPLNTSYDDVYYIPADDGNTAHFSSNRPGSFYLDETVEACCYDIYKVKIGSFADLVAQTFDSGTLDSLFDTEVTLVDLTDPDKADSTLQYSNTASGRFPLLRDKEYLLIANKAGYFPDSVRFNTINISDTNDIVKKLYLTSKELDLEVFVFDFHNKNPLLGATVTLIDQDNPEDPTEITNLDSNLFVFPLERGKTYRIIGSRKGYKPETVIIDTDDFSNVSTITQNIFLRRGELEDFLPLALFFDNDHPVPDSWDRSTDMRYSETYPPYYAKKDTFIEVFTQPLEGEEADEAALNLNRFFETEVKKGKVDMQVFLQVLDTTLVQGEEVSIFLKGYASPRASNAYNFALGYRRVSSVYNEFSAYGDGQLKKYLDSGQLKIKLRSFGETNAPSEVPDDLDDPRLSIYSVPASKERRVEIIHIEVGNNN